MADTFPADDLPLMAPDRAQVETWLRVLTLTSELLRDTRLDREIEAFSEAEQAAVNHDQTQRSALEPGVRPLTDPEHQQWGGGHQAEEHRVSAPTADLRVRVGPLANGRWAMDADITATTGDRTPTSAVVVSCQTEQLAREIADEVLSAGPDPDTLDRLARTAAQRQARHTEATAQVREPEHHRLARTREAIRRTWSPELAERVIAAEGFAALAARLHELEERGATLPTVLGRMSPTQLSKPTVRDPARLAGWMARNQLTVIEGHVDGQVDGHDGPKPTSPASSPTAAAPAPGRDVPPTAAPDQSTRPGQTAGEHQWRQATTDDIVWPALRGALPDQLCETLRASPGYSHLLDDLSAKQANGWSLDALLTGLPADKINEAGDPARYLSAIVGRRASATAPPRTGVDKVAMAAIVRDALPADLATQVLACPAWPALATTMAHHHNTATPGEASLREMLAGMPVQALGRARKPAAYAASLLNERLSARKAATLDADQPRYIDSTVRMAQPDSRRRRAGHGSRPDPASAIDRISLQDAPDLARPDQVTLITDPSRAAHQQAAADATREADRDERAAGYEFTDAAHNPDPEQAQNADGVARIDDNLAAGYRATAADEIGAANAAALRAEVLFTPTVPATTPPTVLAAGTQPAITQARPRLRQNTANLDRNRTR